MSERKQEDRLKFWERHMLDSPPISPQLAAVLITAMICLTCCFRR